MVLLNDEEIRKAIGDYGFLNNHCYEEDYYTSNKGEFEALGKALSRKMSDWLDRKTNAIKARVLELEAERAPLIERLDDYSSSWTDEEERFMSDSVHEICESPKLLELLDELRQSVLKEIEEA